MYYSLGFVLSKWRIAGSKKFNREGGQGVSLARDQPTPCNEDMPDEQEWSSETFPGKSDSSRKQRMKKREALFIKCFVSWYFSKARQGINKTLQTSCLVLIA